MKKILGFAERGFTVLALLFSTTPLIPLLRIVTGGSVIHEGDPLIQAIWFAIYLVNIFLIIVRWRRFIYVATRDKFLLLLIGLALASVLWSTDPMLTLRRSVVLVGTTIFGLYLASRYSFKEQLQLLAWALGIAALLSLLFVVVPPNYGIETRGVYAGVWRGIYHQKNVLGRVMSLSAVVFLLLALRGGRYGLLNWAGFGLSTGLLMLSTAKGSLVSLLTVVVLLPLYKALRWHYSLRVPFLISVVLISGSVVTYLLSNAETILGALGKDITLTGRTDLWFLLFEMGQQQPWLGYGYNGFWLGWNGPSEVIWSALKWSPNHAHNGFIQLWLDLGLVGVLLFTLSFIKASLGAVAWIRLTKTAEGFWPLVYLAFMLLNNVAESVILVSNDTFWILYVATTLSMTVQRDQDRRTSYISKTLNKGVALNM